MTSIAMRPRAVLADVVPGSWVRDAVLVAGAAGLTGLAAQGSFTVPAISPVPFTLETLTVLVAGAALGPVRGLLSMALYLLAGVAGVPWFAHHTSGWGGASFGYVLGFVLAAGVVGALARRGNDRSVLSAIGLMAVGEIVILTVGTVWLGHDLHVGSAKAIQYGVTPFLVWDLLKLVAAALGLPAAWRLVRR
jgi:biotin transport system substrate-specific component